MTRRIININKDGRLTIGEHYHPKNESETEESFELSQVPEISEKYRSEGFDLVLSQPAKQLLIDSNFPQINVRKINNKYYKTKELTRLRPNLLADSVKNGSVQEVSASDVEQLLVGEPLIEEGVTSYRILNI